MDRHLAGEIMPATGGLDGIDVADQVGDGHIGSRQLLYVAVMGRQV